MPRRKKSARPRPLYVKRPTPVRKGYLRGQPMHIPLSTQQKYAASIGEMVDHMCRDVQSEIEKLYNTDYAKDHLNALSRVSTVGMDARGPSFSSQLRILSNALKRKWDKAFAGLASQLSPWMTDSINAASARSMHGSVPEHSPPDLKAAARSMTLDPKKLDKTTLNILRGATDASTNFITTIPEKHLNTVSSALYDSIANGKGLSHLQEYLDKQDVQTKNWSHNTAMDQTRKAYNGLNYGRMKKLGIKKAEWIHSGGSQHPRELHEEFDGQPFDLDKGAPVGDYDGNYVMPGEEPNCRCTMAPILVFDDDDDEAEDDDKE